MAEMDKQLLFDHPQVSRLTSKRRAVNLSQGRKPIPVVPAKEGVQTLVRIDAQEFANDFHGQHFTIRKLGLWTSLANAFALKPIVNQTIHADQIGGNIHGEDLRSHVFA
jgi:hypothetical protein